MDVHLLCFTLPRRAPPQDRITPSPSYEAGLDRSIRNSSDEDPLSTSSLNTRRSTSSIATTLSSLGHDSSGASSFSTNSTAATSINSHAFHPQSKANGELSDAMHKLSTQVMAAQHCIVSCSIFEPSKSCVFHVSGAFRQVMLAKGQILRDSPLQRSSTVKVPRSEVLDARDNVKAEMRRKLDEIASLTKAHLSLVGQVATPIGYGLEAEGIVEIVITGSYESVEQARVRLLVLLDELSGLHSEVCELDYKLHNIISGRKRAVIQTIQEETATNIYFPTPLSGVLETADPFITAKQNLIFITGEFFNVQRARDMIFQVSIHRSKCIISRETPILPRKIDSMLLDRLEEVKQIMHDNGTFIHFPAVGSQSSQVQVYGDHRTHIERTIRALMQLASQFCSASLWLLPQSFDMFMPSPAVNPAQISTVLRHIAASTGAEAVFKTNCFEFHGTENNVKAAIQLVLGLDVVKGFHHEIRFQIELANEHREFITGKKNGKLNKIMKAASVTIKFQTLNEYNFLIELTGSGAKALSGLTLLQDELPAEISFHVPEIYHKRIIGVGGKNIQRIMKKYGVYVKFSNAEEHAALGGYLDNEDNVIARTPAKNAPSLDHIKQAVMEMVVPRDKDFLTETVAVPRRYHRTLLGEKAIFVHDIEHKTNSVIRFPNKETASDMVSIYGPESQVHIAAQMLLDHVPFEAEFRVPHSAEMAALAISSDFVQLTETIKRDYNVSVMAFVDRTGVGEETVVRFLLNRSNQHFLPTARDSVEEFLLNKGISLYPGSLRPRSDSFTTAFPFFNSKLLSNGDTSDKTAEVLQEKRIRIAASTPDIKRLFDSPSKHAHSTSLSSTPTNEPQLSPVSVLQPLSSNHTNIPSHNANGNIKSKLSSIAELPRLPTPRRQHPTGARAVSLDIGSFLNGGSMTHEQQARQAALSSEVMDRLERLGL